MGKGINMRDNQLLLQAGIDPKTGAPTRMQSYNALKEAIKKNLRILDEQDAIRRYKWFNIPQGLDAELIERILYYKGQGAFFYHEELEKFFFLPFTLSSSDGTGIDVYGRFIEIAPIPFNGTTELKTDEDKKKFRSSKLYQITTAWRRYVQYEILDEEADYKDIISKAVILTDYCKQISQTNLPRATLQDPIINAMSEAFPMARTSLLANSGIRGMRVNSPDDAAQVNLANKMIETAAMNGEPFIAMTSPNEYQELSGGAPLKSEEFLIYLQALDNFRMSFYGLKTGGLFQKKSHMLESEQEMNTGNNSLVYEDGLSLRQHFCDVVNSIWDLGIWCEDSEEAMGIDPTMMMDDGSEEPEQEESGSDDE